MIHSGIHGDILMNIEEINKGQTMRDGVKEEMSHIPRGNASQNKLRMFYWPLRMNSLGKRAETSKTKEEILIEAINAVRIDDVEFIPKYDKQFFKVD
jgi:hypothetical protein